MALILAIALGLFWIIKLTYENQKVRESQKEYNTVRENEVANEKIWRDAVTNRQLEKEIEDRLYNKDPVLLEEYKQTVAAYPFTALGGALRVLMANRGRIPYKDSELGIEVIAYGNTQKEKDDSLEQQLQFTKWVANKVRKHGMSNELYFDSFGRIVPIDEAKCAVGNVKWRPMISEFQIKHSNR